MPVDRLRLANRGDLNLASLPPPTPGRATVTPVTFTRRHAPFGYASPAYAGPSLDRIYEVYEENASPRAKEALERIAELFAIEAWINGCTPPERLAAREQDAVQLLTELRIFLERALSQISGKSTLAKAIRYSLSRWTALTRYTTDGRLEMTDNAAERNQASDSGTQELPVRRLRFRWQQGPLHSTCSSRLHG